MEGGWGDGCEIKGKNSSEITKLFIFPALRLWAFEASTLMSGHLGAAPARGHLWKPHKGTSVPSAAAAHGAFEVGPGGVYPPSCMKRVHSAGVAAVWGWWGWERGDPSSLMSLFIWEPERHFLWLLLNVLCRPKAFIPEEGWLAHTLPTAQRLSCPPLVHLARRSLRLELSVFLAPSSSRGLVRT